MYILFGGILRSYFYLDTIFSNTEIVWIFTTSPFNHSTNHKANGHRKNRKSVPSVYKHNWFIGIMRFASVHEITYVCRRRWFAANQTSYAPGCFVRPKYISRLGQTCRMIHTIRTSPSIQLRRANRIKWPSIFKSFKFNWKRLSSHFPLVKSKTAKKKCLYFCMINLGCWCASTAD